jgi:hypothetical protein
MNNRPEGRSPTRKYRHLDRGRLRLDLDMQQVKIEKFLEVWPESEAPPRAQAALSWETAAKRYRTIAKQFADQGNLNDAWTALKAADRELLHAYTDQEIEDEAARVRLEAESKLDDWRQKFIFQCIPAVDNEIMHERNRCAPSVEIVKECRRVLDDALDNKYRKLSLLRQRLKYSAFALIGSVLIAVAAWLIAIGTGLSPGDLPHLLSDWRSVLVVLNLGSLGASLSGLLSLRDQKLNVRIPDLREGWALLVWRPVVGAASALVLVLLLQSGVGGLALDSSAALVAAVVAGFSEQAVSGAVGRASAVIEKS